ncbi:hypothetical protein C1H46_012462 [Malus baccata]|uniref:Uncharacterized protein n=1 Tax=Malus baccata TaxID=106549 RepID=A0A540MST2_MALBA|nr:hypothetical protein C1H46_012462 [Malus baccata]
MAIAFCFAPSSSAASSSSLSKLNPQRPSLSASASSPLLHLRLTVTPPSLTHRHRQFRRILFSAGDDDGGINGRDSSGGGGGGDDGDSDGGSDNAGGKNRAEALMVLAQSKRGLESLPKDLAAAVQAGRIPGSVVGRYFELEKSGLFRWLMQFAGFRERLLADDLFFAKVFMECGVGLFTKVMAILADFMLVYLPAPTVSLRPPLGLNAGAITRFFHGCPDNAFQIAMSGTSYSLLQRIGGVVRNGTKLFAVGTASSLVTAILMHHRHVL